MAAGTFSRDTLRLGTIVVIAATMLSLVALEVGARIWVAARWPKEKVFLLTHATELRGRFRIDGRHAYSLRPDYRDPSGIITHNSYGFRGPAFEVPKPDGALRIVLMGASTVYGLYVRDEETAAQRLEDMLAASHPERRVEVLNAGVPGWTSAETVRYLEDRVLPLRPDVVLIADGRNEIFPQLFDGYREDYSHYRVRDVDFRRSNLGYKRLFRISHLAMWMVARGDGYFGFDWRAENPANASVNYANLPPNERIGTHARDTSRTAAFRHNLREAIRLADSANVRVVLSTIPFLAERYHSGVIPRDSAIIPTLAGQVARNNAIVREVAAERHLPLVDPAARLTRDELLRDDCHFNADGEQAWAELMLREVEPLIGPPRLLAARVGPGSAR